jgi:tetratricopeptide (TPR) repeat protein
MPHARLTVSLLALSALGYAEKGMLTLSVSDLTGHPLGRKYGVHIKVKDPGSSAYTDDNGTLPLPLGPDIVPGDAVELVLLEPDTLFMVSPWDSRIIVPSFQSKGGSFVDVLLAAKGSIDALRNARVREAIAARIDRGRAPHTVDDRSTNRGAADLAREAQATGYTPEQLDHALRDWANTAKSPREKAIAALFLGDYNTAVQQSQAALGSRDNQSAGQGLFDMSLFLAQALFEIGDFARAADEAKIAVGLRPRDERALNLWGICLSKAGKDDTAIAALRSAAAIEKQLSSSDVATFNVAEELYRKGELGAAEALYRQVLADQSKLTAPDADLASRTKIRLTAIGQARTLTATAGPRWTAATWVAVVLGVGAALAIGAGLVKWLTRRQSYYRVEAPRLPDLSARNDYSYTYQAPRPTVVLKRSPPRYLTPAFAVVILAGVILSTYTLQRAARPPIPTATEGVAARSYTVTVQMVDPAGRDTKTVNCWSSVSGDRSQSGDSWTFRFLLAQDAKLDRAEFFADDAQGNRSGRAAVTLTSDYRPSLTMRLSQQREPVFSGTVVDRSAAPVPNALINVLGSAKSTHSGADGRFSFQPDEITTKPLLLSVSAPGLGRTVIPRLSDQTNLQVSLSRP